MADESATRRAIEVRGLSRTYHVGDSEVHALRGVDLDIVGGAFVGLVGVSGSGKSRLLQLIGGLDTPTSGSIVVEGRDLTQLSRRERSFYRRETIGFVFQSFFLVP